MIFKYHFFDDIQIIDNSWNLNRVLNFTALSYAAQNGYIEMARELLSQPSIDVNIGSI